MYSIRQPAAASNIATIVLAVKPQVASEIMPSVAALAGPGTLVLSIMAGKTLSFLQAAMLECGRSCARHAEYAGRDRPRHHRRRPERRRDGGAKAARA